MFEMSSSSSSSIPSRVSRTVPRTIRSSPSRGVTCPVPGHGVNNGSIKSSSSSNKSGPPNSVVKSKPTSMNGVTNKNKTTTSNGTNKSVKSNR
jgi:hypothetical protein